jgi:hypothetical protein
MRLEQNEERKTQQEISCTTSESDETYNEPDDTLDDGQDDGSGFVTEEEEVLSQGNIIKSKDSSQ